MERDRRVAFFVVIAVVVLAGFAASVDARPPPQPLCEVCADEVVDDAVVEKSTVTIQIDETGTGHWTIELQLNEGVTAAESVVEGRARGALDGHRNEPAPQNLTVSTSGKRVLMTYDVPNMGHRSTGDVLIVDYFYSHGDDGHWYGVNADRVVVRGPDGSTLTRSPTSATVNDSTVVLDGEYGDVFSKTISKGWYLAYATDDGVFASTGTIVGIWADIAQAKGDGLVAAVWLPLTITGVTLGVLSRRESLFTDRGIRQRAIVITELTAVLAVASVAVQTAIGAVHSTGPLTRHFEIAVFSFLYGTIFSSGVLVAVPAVGAILFVLMAPRFDFGIPHEWIRKSGGFVAAISLLGGVWAAGTDIWLTDVYGASVAVLTVGLFYSLGLSERAWTQVLLSFAILTSPVLVALGLGPFSGYTRMYFPLLFVPWVLVTVAVGTFGYVYGLTRIDTNRK